MVGEATGRTYKLGMPVTVRTVECDKMTRTIDFSLVSEEEEEDEEWEDRIWQREKRRRS